MQREAKLKTRENSQKGSNNLKILESEQENYSKSGEPGMDLTDREEEELRELLNCLKKQQEGGESGWELKETVECVCGGDNMSFPDKR